MDKLRVETARAKASARFGWARLRHSLQPNAVAAPPSRLADVYEDAFAKYDVKPYPGELTVFLAKRHLLGFRTELGEAGERLHQAACGFFRYPLVLAAVSSSPMLASSHPSCALAWIAPLKTQRPPRPSRAWNW